MSEEEILLQQIRDEPENVALLKKLAYVYDQAGKYGESVAQYVAYLQKGKNDADARLSLAWGITKRLKGLDAASPRLKETLLFYLKHAMSWIQGVGRPSLVYTLLLARFTKLVKGFRREVTTEIAEAYLQFVEDWGLQHLRVDDYAPYHPEEGKTYPSLCQSVVACVYRCACAVGAERVQQKFAWCADFLAEQITRYPEEKWFPYYYGKVLMLVGKSEEARLYFLEIAKGKRDEFWLWQGLAETYPEEDPLRETCLCRALLCNVTDEKYLVVVHEMFGGLLRHQGRDAEALREYALEDEIRAREGWHPRERDDAFLEWSRGKVASPTNEALYQARAKEAEYHLFPSERVVNLSAEQQEALSRIEAFLEGEDQVFLLRGYAGTGKTTLIRSVLALLKQKYAGRPRYVVAPTGRAAKILCEKCGMGETIHRRIYRLESMNESRDAEGCVRRNGARIQYCFPLKEDSWGERPILIADEASMISSHTKESERLFFGSGSLLNDLLEYADLPGGGKILFVGDPAQLPPDGEAHSRALEEATFEAAGLRVTGYTLRTVFRQAEGSILLQNAFRLREVLEKPKSERQYFAFESQDGGFQKTDFRMAVEALTASKEESQNAIAIAFSNASVARINQAVRSRLFEDISSPQVGDRILFVRNAYDHITLNWHPGQTPAKCVPLGRLDIYNGDRGVIEYVGKCEMRSAYVGQERVGLKFRNLLIRHESGAFVSSMVVETLLDSASPDLLEKEESALFTDFVARHSSLRNKENRELFLRELRNDPYFNALRVKYGYAITCHKSQGGEWARVYVDFAGRNGLDDDALRWAYTAITRAAKEFYYFGREEFSAFACVSFGPIQDIQKLGTKTIQWPRTETTQFHDSCSMVAKCVRYHDVQRALPPNYMILSVRSHDYDEIYDIQLVNEVIRLKATHDAAGIFSEFRLIDGAETDPVRVLLERLRKPVRHVFDVTYTPSSVVLKDLYEIMTGLCEEVGVAIANVEEELDKYFVRYTIETDAWASLQFFMNARGQLTRINAASTRGNMDLGFAKLYEKLQEALSV